MNAAIRDYVYRTNVVGPSRSEFTHSGEYYAALGSDDAMQACGGMSTALKFALDSVGIPARTVQLAGQEFLKGSDRFETHVTVEAYLGGKWEISDPTFNMSVNCSTGGENLSVPEAASCVTKGGKLIGVPGDTQIRGRSVEDYYAPYETFFAAYSRTPVSGPIVSAAVDEQPSSGWLNKALQLYDD